MKKIPVLTKGYVGLYAGRDENTDVDVSEGPFIDARKGLVPSLICSCGNCGDYSSVDLTALKAAVRQIEAIERKKPAALRKAERILQHATEYLYTRDWSEDKSDSNPAFRILHKALHG